MPKSIVTAIDVFADTDLEHACAAIRRVGGGIYRVVLHGEDIGPLDEKTGTRLEPRHDFDNDEEALQFAMETALLVEADPSLMSPASVHALAEANEAKAALEAERTARSQEKKADTARIAQLEALLAKEGTPVPPVLPADKVTSDKGK